MRMKAAVVKNCRIEILDLKKPELSQNGAIIRVLGCGLCGSDIIKYKDCRENLVLGHEIVGEIVEINSLTDFKAGDKIVMGHHVPCFECVYCAGESFSMCEQFKSTNIVPGGFCEFLFASEKHLEHTVFKVPQNLENEEASFTEPLACCLRAISRADLQSNANVLVVGLGSIGLLMGQTLKNDNHRVFGCDLIEQRVDFAHKTGFDEAILYENDDKTASRIKELTQNIGVDAVFMTSGSSKSIKLALNSVRNGGKLVIFSSVSDMASYTNDEIYYRELSIIGAYSPAPKDLKRSLELLSGNKVVVKNFSSTYNLDNLQRAIDDSLSSKILKAYIEIRKI